MKSKTKIPQNTQFEQEKENEQRLRTLWDNNKKTQNVCHQSQKKRRSVRLTNCRSNSWTKFYVFAEKQVQLNKPQTKLNPKKSMLRHIIIKLLKKLTEKSLKTRCRKITYRGMIQITVSFRKKPEGQRKLNSIFKQWKQKNYKLGILYQQKIFFRNEGAVKMLSDEGKTKDFCSGDL